MKRMSEVFKLPVNGFELEYLMSKTTGDDDDSIARAINNVDTMADALDACVKVLGQMPAGEPANESDRAYHQALDALSAYRGAK